MREWFGAGLLAVAALGSTPAWAAVATVPSGTAIAVVQSSQVDSTTGRRALAPEGPVFPGDRILTGNIGEAQLRFRDGTKLVVGPNSSMVLDAFVFNADNTARQVAIDAAKGAFRFITGNGPKDAYSITTPTATIAVRGTAFDFEVERSGTTRVAVFSGATQTCDRLRRNCIVQTANCDVAVIERNRVPRPVASRDQRQGELQLYFPYVVSQASLLVPFRVDLDSCGFTVRADIQQTDRQAEVTRASLSPIPLGPPPPSPGDDGPCGGNCGIGNGNGGGNGTGNEGNGNGPPDDHPGKGGKDKD